MQLSEFAIIKKYFDFPATDDTVIVANGDDAAVVRLPQGYDLALCIDTLVAGVHFLEGTDPFDIAYRAVAVNLSDLAAIGASPKWIILALTIPQAEPVWLQAFSQGLKNICDQYSIQLIGGDLTRGPLTISVSAHGLIPQNKALTRKGAKVGDKIYVTGHLGNAGLALMILKNEITVSTADRLQSIQAYHRPQAWVQLGIYLRDIASSCIDISDGLIADLGHILEQSKVGATIYLEKIPLSPLLKRYLVKEAAYNLALTFGDDYQLCFTVPPTKVATLKKQMKHFPIDVHCIGEITAETRLAIFDSQENEIEIDRVGYEHF